MHHQSLLETAAEKSRSLSAQVEQANESQSVSEAKAASLGNRLAEVQAEASVAVMEAERAKQAEVTLTYE